MGRFFIVVVLLLFVCGTGVAAEVSGRIGVESRIFLDDSQFQNSAFFEPELYWSWNGDSDSILFKTFVRIDDLDTERTHGDIRELQWLHVGDNWELRIGIGKVYWGVSESQHLVDIINQTDIVESVDREEKLGQPMVQFSLIRDWGNIDLFVMPYFRERNFGGKDARLQGPIPIDTDNPLYESDRKNRHVDYALRWSQFFGDWDIGLSYFTGTSRDPTLLPQINTADDSVFLTPFYPLIDQIGLDVQATLGSWLWKLEAIKRVGLDQDYRAMTVGFEYTFVGLFESALDLGLLMGRLTHVAGSLHVYERHFKFLLGHTRQRTNMHVGEFPFPNMTKETVRCLKNPEGNREESFDDPFLKFLYGKEED